MNILLFSTSRSLDRYYNYLLENTSDNFNCTVFSFDQKLPSPSLKYISKARRLNFLDIIDFKLKYKKANKKLKLNFIKPVEYSLEAFILSLRVSSLLKEKTPDLVVIWNGGRLKQRVVAETAKLHGLPVLYMENGLLPNTTSADRKGVNYNSSVPKNKDFYLTKKYQFNFSDTVKLDVRASTKKLSKTKTTLPEKFIFVPFQVESDSQIITHSPWIKSMRELFFLCKRYSEKKDKNIKFVFKEHPSSDYKYDDLYNLESDQLIFANGTPTEKLIRKSEAIITINSSVGIESLLLKKKVITLGNAIYNIDGICKHASSIKELENHIDSIDSWIPDQNLISYFLGYLENEYSIKGSWRSPDLIHVQSWETRALNIINESN